MTVCVEDWFLKDKNIKEFKEAKLLKVTEKAMLFELKNKTTVWIPRSLMSLRERKERTLSSFYVKRY